MTVDRHGGLTHADARTSDVKAEAVHAYASTKVAC